jgi:hypothetical protein
MKRNIKTATMASKRNAAGMVQKGGLNVFHYMRAEKSS